MSVVSSPLQVAGKLPRPLPWGGVVAGAELTATSDAAITPVTAIRLLLIIVLMWVSLPSRVVALAADCNQTRRVFIRPVSIWLHQPAPRSRAPARCPRAR